MTHSAGTQFRSTSASESIAAEAWNQTEPPFSGEASNASDAREDDNESVALDGNLSNGNLVSTCASFVHRRQNQCSPFCIDVLESLHQMCVVSISEDRRELGGGLEQQRLE